VTTMFPTGVRRVAGTLGVLAGAAVAVEHAPALVALGQWGPLRALPGGACRWGGPRSSLAVALTFDDGPDPVTTPAVLDALDGLGVRGTFFVVGERARRHPDLVQEIAARGHQLASHGDVHTSHLLRSPRWVGRDLRRAVDAMTALGHRPRWYRPAYGHVSASTIAAARRLGLEVVLWSCWGREWADADPGAVAARVSRRIGPGAVVLLHDGEGFGPPGMVRIVVDALPLIAHALRRRNLDAVTLDELVR
jgi:peptidoglycan/xylan/chitin deacetylase (PgdA/CDA1 family)